MPSCVGEQLHRKHAQNVGYGSAANHRRPALDRVVATGEPEQAKALLRILITKLQVNGRNEILPTNRVGAPTVCAPTSSMEPTEVNANCFAQVSGGQMPLDEAA
jgi:hypothetical protein